MRFFNLLVCLVVIDYFCPSLILGAEPVFLSMILGATSKEPVRLCNSEVQVEVVTADRRGEEINRNLLGVISAITFHPLTASHSCIS